MSSTNLLNNFISTNLCSEFANLLLFDLRISLVTTFLNVMYLLKSLPFIDFLNFLKSRFFLSY